MFQIPSSPGSVVADLNGDGLADLCPGQTSPEDKTYVFNGNRAGILNRSLSSESADCEFNDGAGAEISVSH